MFTTPSRLFQAARPVWNAACTTSGPSKGKGLPAIRYHVFKNPLPYPTGLKVQTELLDYRLARKAQGGGKNDIILMLEHTPTYTTGRRDNSPNPDTLHPEEKKVQNVGAGFYITKRGGQVTYHGPGQLVGYPILDLNNMETPTRCYVDWVQDTLATYVRDQGCERILAPHPEGHVGVFASPTEKVASIGIHLRHRITSHGFAMNITREPLKWFDLVMACGLADVRATSLQDLIARSANSNGLLPPSMPDVRDVAEGLIPRFAGVFGRDIIRLTEASETEHGEGGEELREMWRIIQRAEKEAEEINAKGGGWPTEPNLSGRQI